MTEQVRPVPTPPKLQPEPHVSIQADRAEQEPSTDVSVRRNDYWKSTPITVVVKVRGVDGASVITELRRALELAEKQLTTIDNHVDLNKHAGSPDEIKQKREAMHPSHSKAPDPKPVRSLIPGIEEAR